MTKEKTIKNMFSDVLYWVMSPASKRNHYHLTRSQESVLRKLIHYDSSNPKITYSNKVISYHTYLDISTIEKVIPALNRKGYIKVISHKIKDGTGSIVTRRTININWHFFETILNAIPKNEPSNTEESTGKADPLINLTLDSLAPELVTDFSEVMTFETNGDEMQISMEVDEVASNHQIQFDEINMSPEIREKVRQEINEGKTPVFINVFIYDDGEIFHEGQVVSVTDEHYPQRKYMLRDFIENPLPKHFG